MALNIIDKVQLGNQMAICLYNDSNKDITLIDFIFTCDNAVIGLPSYGNNKIQSKKFNIIIAELPTESGSSQISYETNSGKYMIGFNYEPLSDTGGDTDALKNMMIDKLDSIIRTYDIERMKELLSAIITLKKL